jgi:O-antigen/teichoic acid export membrane protein
MSFWKRFDRSREKMSRIRTLMTSVLANWTALAVSIAVSFFLAPFVVHHLGNVAYGVWILTNSSITYMALLDLGMRSAVTHFVAKHQARGEDLESSQAVSFALAFRVLISMVVIVATLLLAAFASKIFHIPPELRSAARWAIILSGVNLSLGMIFGLFGGVLAALQRFDLISGITISQTLVGAAGTVWLLRNGHGIILLAALQLAVAVILGLATILICHRVYPQLRVGVRYIDRKIIPELWRYSFYLFVIAAGGQIIYYTDNLVVGAFLSAEAVTLYAIGGRFIDYIGQLGASFAQTFMPMASNLAANDQREQLKRLLIHGTRAVLLVCLPIGWVLLFRGSAFIGLWMGQQFAQPSGQVLRILLLSSLALTANRVGGNLILGLGKHRPFALWQLGEAIANLALSIFLVRKIGIYGVAWGTVLPSLVSQVILWPRHISKHLGLSVWTYFGQCWVRPALATLPFCLACIWTDHYWEAATMTSFFIQLVAASPLIALGIILTFWREFQWQWRRKDSVLRRNFFARLRFGTE